jgi:hypothetical protein
MKGTTMKKRNRFINTKGEIFDTDSDICPDGCGISAKMMLMDGLDGVQREIARSYSRPAQITDRSHQPGFRLANASSDMRDAAVAADDRAIRKRQLSDAWRTTGASYLGQPEPDEPDEPDTTNEADDARELRKAQISSAWRTPSINPADPKARVFEKNWQASFTPYETDAADAAHAELVKRVCDAWRQGA